MICPGSVQVMSVGIASLTACASAPPAQLANFAEPVHIESGDDVQELAGVDSGLTASLVEAVKRCHFKPATVRGEPVAAYVEHAEWTLTPFTTPAVERVLAPPRQRRRK